MLGEADDAPVHFPALRGGEHVGRRLRVPVRGAVPVRVRLGGAVRGAVGLCERAALLVAEVPRELPAREGLADDEARRVAEDGHDGDGGNDEASVEEAGAIVVRVGEGVGDGGGRGGV